MNIIRVKAIFKGADGSLGYKARTEYTLVVHHEAGMHIQVEDVEGTAQRCDYGSMVAFMKNWDNIRNI